MMIKRESLIFLERFLLVSSFFVIRYKQMKLYHLFILGMNLKVYIITLFVLMYLRNRSVFAFNVSLNLILFK